jgi:anti-anti-sigma factor
VTGVAMTNRPPRFEVERASPSGPPGVIVRGEVDISTVSDLALALDEAIRGSTGAFIVDLCAVDFLDSTGVSVLVRARAVLARDDRALVVVCPEGPVRRVFEVTGITDLLTLFDSREEATTALRPVD